MNMIVPKTCALGSIDFDNVTSQKNVDRKDAYQPDPNIPAQYRTDRQDYYSPYNRGHMELQVTDYIAAKQIVKLSIILISVHN